MPIIGRGNLFCEGRDLVLCGGGDTAGCRMKAKRFSGHVWGSGVHYPDIAPLSRIFIRCGIKLEENLNC